MSTLDLHGTKHQNVEDKVRSFLNFVDLPCYIITGNSQLMKNIVKNIVEEYKWHCHEKDSYNHGTLIIKEELLR